MKKQALFLCRSTADFERMFPLYKNLKNDLDISFVFCGDFYSDPRRILSTFQYGLVKKDGKLSNIEEFYFLGHLLHKLYSNLKPAGYIYKIISRMSYILSRGIFQRLILKNIKKNKFEVLLLDNIGFEEKYFPYEIYMQFAREQRKIFIIGHGAGESLKTGWGASHTKAFPNAIYLSLTKSEYEIQISKNCKTFLIGDLRYSSTWLEYLKSEISFTKTYDFGILLDSRMDEVEEIIFNLLEFMELNKELFNEKKILIKAHPRFGIDPALKALLIEKYKVIFNINIDTFELIQSSNIIIVSDMSSTLFEPLILRKKVIILKNKRKGGAIIFNSPLYGIGNFYIEKPKEIELKSITYDWKLIHEKVDCLCWAGLGETNLEKRAASLLLTYV